MALQLLKLFGTLRYQNNPLNYEDVDYSLGLLSDRTSPIDMPVAYNRPRTVSDFFPVYVMCVCVCVCVVCVCVC